MGERVANTGYDYSRAMKRANFRWTPQDMEEFLLSPKKKVPGNSMSFTGIRNAAERSDLIAYLIFLSGT
jgi:cytochrome c